MTEPMNLTPDQIGQKFYEAVAYVKTLPDGQRQVNELATKLNQLLDGEELAVAVVVLFAMVGRICERVKREEWKVN